MLYADQPLPIRAKLRAGHEYGWREIAMPGTWWSATERVEMLLEARRALDCSLCARRQEALSPYTLDGDHDHGGNLPDNVIEVVHRIRTDSGRLTERWFKSMLDTGLLAEEYIEIVGIVATSLILDTFAEALGVPPGLPGDPAPGAPSRERNPAVVDAGAWVPLTNADQEDTALGLPSAPNITRAMGIVPGAVDNFFGVFRGHYALANLDFAITRPQIEMIAARVSALNQCFY